tara:strand:- start:4258 stop:8088 length:3831 start_codon:yes stop_codon:yes gene_type:complete
MSKIELSPSHQHLSQEYLLVPAWKKAHNYIRWHNWYSDVLDLDLTNAGLEVVIQEIIDEITSDEPLLSTPLRLVPAPKKQVWHIKNEKWESVDGITAVDKKLRPLAHVSVRDQIISTAFMILFADIVETRQGDPKMSASKARDFKMVSYGHRLFCDKWNENLKYRWGNSGIYRQYFQDYQNFVARPEQTVAEEFGTEDVDWAIISADLSQYYDRVRPSLLHAKVKKLLGKKYDQEFYDSFESFFQWEWDNSDTQEALKYAKKSSPEISGYERVALPQGLASSGFFSNIVLLDFDDAVSECFGEWDTEGDWQLIDYCRYVDDMRFVVRLDPEKGTLKKNKLESLLIKSITRFLTEKLSEHAEGLVINPEKCEVVLGRNAAAGSVKVSSSMRRINHDVSGVMDLFVGEQTLDLIETLLYSSETNTLGFNDRFQDTVLAAKPDVGEATTARFAANRFRNAYRTLRPMLESSETQLSEQLDLFDEVVDDWNTARFHLKSTLTREVLDQKGSHFASRLIERWIRDPSNMRLLRVALDLRPDVRTLNAVIDLLNEYLAVNSKQKSPKRVVWYCAAELLKAGATETGLVDDADKLPDGISLNEYQNKLAELAREVLSRKKSFPWYLVQQAYLFLACFGEYIDQSVSRRSKNSHDSYIYLHKALSGNYQELLPQTVPKYALLHANLESPDNSAKAFVKRLSSESPALQRKWIIHIMRESQTLAHAVWNHLNPKEKKKWRRLFVSYGILVSKKFPSRIENAESGTEYSLLAVAQSPGNPFQQEYLAILFALKIIPLLLNESNFVTPNRIKISAPDWYALRSEAFPVSDKAFRVKLSAFSTKDRRYWLPDWVSDEDSWKYQLGMILRVLLTGVPDYTLDDRSYVSRSRVIYRPLRSSWLKRRYGMFNGRNAFGPPWLPISSWFGSLLNKLLEWPGFPAYEFDLKVSADSDVNDFIELLEARIGELEKLYGVSAKLAVLPILVPKSLGAIWNGKRIANEKMMQLMRVGVAQTVIPRKRDFIDHGPELINSDFRRMHRRHSASVLAGVQRMLEVRTTHQDAKFGIELLVLPELSIHPNDINSILLPFVKKNNCIICAGLVFHQISPNQSDLINTAVWLIPVRKPTGGIDVEVVYQGKMHMTQDEVDLNITPFRPAQWVLHIVDPNDILRKLWSMTGSVCYDSTDLQLAADLRDETDLFVVPALNIDVGLFDNMAAALHYHMFQHVVVANTGEFGGSSAHAPFSDKNQRTIFHTHGNDQVAVSFFEIDFDLYQNGGDKLKTPPANFQGR